MKRHPHPSGVDILFDAKWHQYKVGQTALRSVSKLLDKHFPFDEKRVLAVVSKKTGQSVEEVKANWNRQALLGKNIHEYIEMRLRGLPPPTWTLLLDSQLKQKQKQQHAAAAAAKDNKKKKGDVAKGKEKKSIADSMLHGEEAAYMKAADTAVDVILRHYDIVAVEQVVASPSWGIGGTIDLIARNKRTRRLLIGDWKTSGNVTSSFRFGSFETPCTGCLMHLPNTKFYRYAMQVAVYGEILKHERYLQDGFFGRTVSPIHPSVKSISVSPQEMHNVLEYGLVHFAKNEEGEVCVELKGITDATVLPVDARETTFMELMKNVLRG